MEEYENIFLREEEELRQIEADYRQEPDFDDLYDAWKEQEILKTRGEKQ